MQLKKTQIYITLMFTLFPAFNLQGGFFDLGTWRKGTYLDEPYLNSVKDEEGRRTYLDEPHLYLAKDEDRFFEKYGILGRGDNSFFSDPALWFSVIRGFRDPFTVLLSFPWANGLKDCWRLARFAKWREWHEKEIVDAAGYTARGRDKLLGRNAYAAAIADFDKALSVSPQDMDAYYYRATAKLTLGKVEVAAGNTEHAQRLYHAAIQDYTQVIELTPENIEAHVFRSYAKFKFGAVESAEGNTEHAQRLYHAAIVECNRAIALYRKNETALKAALAIATDAIAAIDFESAVEIRQGYAFPYHIRGLAKRALGQHAAAQADFRRAAAPQLRPEGLFWAPTLGRRSGW